MKTSSFRLTALMLIISMFMYSCSNTENGAAAMTDAAKKVTAKAKPDAKTPSDILSHFDKFNLILGDGSNAGYKPGYQHKDFFFAANDGKTDWVVYKTPNAGDTHGTSNNIRTELAQKEKWSPMSKAKLEATCKIMNVSRTGDERVAASHAVVIGQIHSADGHENEPLKIFYKKFPGHTKGSVFWNYEINTEGADNAGRWDFSTAVWGYDFSVIGSDEKTPPAEPADGIKLGEELTYVIEVKDGSMHLTFSSPGHATKTFTKNLIVSDYAVKANMPAQVKNLFVPIGQDGVERKNAYADEFLFFKQGCYNQTNGKPRSLNNIWCSGAETHGGDISKQYADGNYAEIWFKSTTMSATGNVVSNKSYFTRND